MTGPTIPDAADLRMQKQTEPHGSYTDVDLAASYIGDLKLRISYGHPSLLTFNMRAPQHTRPLPEGTFIRLWDANGAGQSASAPLFEGFVEQVTPGNDSNTVEVVCHDPTRRATGEIVVMSAAWNEGDVSEGDFPTVGTGAIPRVVYNVTIDNDDDYAYARTLGQSIGAMIATVLEDQYHPLYWLNAAPGDGSDAGNGTAYVAADLSPLTFQPQEKVVFDSESVRSAITRLLQWLPANKLLWRPGTRQWRVVYLRDSPETTLTLNDPDADEVVIALQITRSMADRWTSVKYYGPETVETTTVSLSGGGLNNITDDPPILEITPSGQQVFGMNKFQVANSDRRRMARMLPQPISVGGPELRVSANLIYQPSWTTRSPTLQVRYKNNSAGTDRWQAVNGYAYIDVQNGIISFEPNYLYRYNPNPDIEGGVKQPKVEVPEDVRLIYPRFVDPLSVRYPETGFAGSAYDEVGLENEKAIYDEFLAVGFDFAGTPVSTANRLAAFATLAEAVHDELKDVLYVGAAVLDGLQYDYRHLDRRVNFAAKDADGDDLDIGWGEIRAYLSDVEYNFEEQTTTLQFSSDRAEQAGVNMDALRHWLGIRAAITVDRVWWRQTFTLRRSKPGITGRGVLGVDSTITGGVIRYFVDPLTGGLA